MKVNLVKELKNFLFKEREKDKTNKVIGQAVFSFLFKFKDEKGKILLISWKVAITTIILNAIVIILIVKLLS